MTITVFTISHDKVDRQAVEGRGNNRYAGPTTGGRRLTVDTLALSVYPQRICWWLNIMILTHQHIH